MVSIDYPNTIHDAFLTGIELIYSNRVLDSIELRLLEEVMGVVENCKLSLIYEKVKAYKFDEFRHQNIIFGIDIYNGDDEIRKYFLKFPDESIDLTKLEFSSCEMSVISSSIGFNGFIIYKNKTIKRS